MKSLKMAIIVGFAAVCAVIATVIILTSGSGDYGLYVTDLSGNTEITVTGKGNASAVNGVKLNKGDIITVSPDSTCQITYKSKKNKDKNYIILEQDTKVIVSDEFDGKNNGELFLMQGSLICNSVTEAKANVNIRTVNARFDTSKTVSAISLTKSSEDENEKCDFYCFMGTLVIQRYDMLGSAFEKTEAMVTKKKGEIVVKKQESAEADSEEAPVFEFLNVDISLSDLPAYTLKELINISQFVADFTYTTAELKQAYDEAPKDSIESTDTSLTETSAPIETAPPETEATVSHTWEVTTAPVYVPQATNTTTQENNEATESETSESSNESGLLFTVTIIIDDESEVQEVEYGKNAEQPADPVVEGLTFIGWDNSFENITQNTVITALFVSDDPYYTTTTAGGYGDYTVIFVIEGAYYSQDVAYGQSAEPPYIPYTDIDGNVFIGWDSDFSYITGDLTVNAIFS